MDIEIFNDNFQLIVHGFGGIAINKDYVGTVFKLGGKMWETVKSNNIKNKGKNIWVYDAGDNVFAGVELENNSNSDNHGLEEKIINLPKHARYTHTGPYDLIKQAGRLMTNELTSRGFETTLPYIEIYGHWTNDERKLETILIMCLK